VGRTRPDAEQAVTAVAHLDPAEVGQILALTHAAGDADGAYPLSEHVVLHLRHGGDSPATHLLARAGGKLVGYAHVDPTDAVDGPSAELCVHPLFRRQGLGRALVLAAIDAAERHDPLGRLRLWAHGDHPSANALALTLGFVRSRVLWQMRRSLFAPVDVPRLPEGVVLRAFRPGTDDAAWLALNARAFAHLPDQGGWTARDLQARLGEPWFDPAGFLIAERASDGVMLGFHWTKVHGGHTTDASVRARPHEPGEPGRGDGLGPPGELAPDARRRSPAPGHHHDPIGEVYVLGVDPGLHGLGLGAALTQAGLRYLRGRGLDQVMLYVDRTNDAAIRLYQRLGFARWSTDVCFRRPA
jgi:mycothiol synthase